MLARVAGFGALLAAIALVVVLLFGGDSGHRYRLLFETGSQLVAGNEVKVAGQTIGTVDGLTLTDDAQAEVTITVDEPLHENTTAIVRATSLSGIANRYVSIAPGPDNLPEIPEDGIIGASDTISAVDLDQLFDTFDRPTRKALSGFIRGQSTVYAGNEKAANAAYKYLAPGLQSTERLLAELTRDEAVFSQFLVTGGSVLSAVAERRDDLSALTENANQALGAIATENESLDRSLVALPPALRQANTTFVNLRAALDDLDSLVETTGVATRDLAPFLRDLRPVAEEAVPVFADLRQVLSQPGPSNDLADTLTALPAAESAASRSVPVTIKAIDDGQPKIAQLRPYSPDLLGALGRLSQVSSNYDGNGHYVRVNPAGLGIFDYNEANGVLDPIPPSAQFAAFDHGFFNRCPGGSTQPLAGSNPFLDDGALDGLCDPAAVPPGP